MGFATLTPSYELDTETAHAAKNAKLVKESNKAF
jgi:hypothetical protein